jgi:hypothetical protein
MFESDAALALSGLEKVFLNTCKHLLSPSLRMAYGKKYDGIKKDAAASSVMNKIFIYSIFYLKKQSKIFQPSFSGWMQFLPVFRPF